MLLPGSLLAAASTGLERDFASPPDSAKPWVQWMWVDGNISAEGITADLEAMQRVGVGGLLLMDFTQEVPQGKVEFGTPQWHALFKHAVEEAARLGLQFGVNNCPGWTGSGGPWITPEQSMQKLVSARTNLAGPLMARVQLPKLPTYHGYVRDVATLAFPSVPAESTKPLAHAEGTRAGGILEAVLLDDFQAKSGLARKVPSQSTSTIYPAASIIPLEKIIDLSALVTTNGWLSWNVPPGNWTILRLGRMPTGRENPPARPGGLGLECDKLSKEAVDAHFAGFVANLLNEVGPHAGRTLSLIHADSWERGFQNWTPRFREEFQRLRGYDPLRYLPAMSGRVVESKESTERFLWDVRRTIAELFADNYAGHLAELARRNGLQLSIEAYGNGPFDDLLYASRADIPMSEFWNELDEDSNFHTSRGMASAAHTYGKPIVAAEAFTAWPPNGKWQNHPFSLKLLADAAFTEGVNRLVIHRFVHQPWLDHVPGMTMGMWGIHYERTQTWWEYSKPWHEYLARCQLLLQRGQFAADICYMTAEGAFADVPTRAQLQPAPPDGYDYDICPPEAVLTRMSVSSPRPGMPPRLRLPDGMSYGLLVLPDLETATPALLLKIKELLQAGATVVANRKPQRSPSLAGYPECDVTVRALVDELWGTEDRAAPVERRIGAGRLLRGKSLAAILADMKLPADFQQLSATSRPLRRIHRSIDGGEFYFLRNPNTNAVAVECAFRVTDRQPELWHPDTGKIEALATWRTNATHTLIPLRLDSAGSVFVAFRQPHRTAPMFSVTRDAQPLPLPEISLGDSNQLMLAASVAGAYRATAASGSCFSGTARPIPKAYSISNNWELSFPGLAGKTSAARTAAPLKVTLTNLISWTEHPLKQVRYFSGVAKYRTTFEVEASDLSPERRVYLDLGSVCVLAAVRLNGALVGTLWKPPFVADITSQCRAGTNTLELDVANLWPNRLIGDDFLPEDCEWTASAPGPNGAALAKWPDWFLEGKPSPTGRLTFSTRKFWSRESPLLPSGLLGPVTIHFLEQVMLQ